MCGSKTKSSIWEMHMCANTAQDLANAVNASKKITDPLQAASGIAANAGKRGQKGSASLQHIFGQAGDPTASDLLQQAKVRAGELTHMSDDANKLLQGLTAAQEKAAGTQQVQSLAAVKEAEALVSSINADTAKAKTTLQTLSAEVAYYSQANNANATKEYYPLMYFVDTAFVNYSTTCGGDLATKPLFVNETQCATVCNALLTSCAGFGFFKPKQTQGSSSVCFLFSKLKSATYYTGCKDEPQNQAKCSLKFASFVGTSLKPDPSGKSTWALKELTNAARCF